MNRIKNDLPKFTEFKIHTSHSNHEIAQHIHSRMLQNSTTFTEEITHYLNCSWSISSRMKEYIPHEGRVIFWVNSIATESENLSLINQILEFRDDIAIISDDPLIHFINQNDNAPLPEFYNYDSNGSIPKSLNDALTKEYAVVMAAPRDYETGIDQWSCDVMQLAQEHEVPIVPVIYSMDKIFTQTNNQKLADLLQVDNTEVRLGLGELIPVASFSALKPQIASNLLQSHQTATLQGRVGVLHTLSNVVPPADKKKLRKEILKGETLGFTEDNKAILLFEYNSAPTVMQEIARLRELTFRKIGEGTGRRKDTDRFDKHYHHLLLWDDEEMEIVGAYRLGLCQAIINSQGMDGLYSNTLFNYQKSAQNSLIDAVECGRSFVQEKYWNSLALDYLWHGIGAFLSRNPQIKYLYGPVSISQSYTKDARDHLIFFYSRWFQPDRHNIKSRNPYKISDKSQNRLTEQYPGKDYKLEFRALKKNLKMLGFAVPTLYKQYTELCESGGVQFHDFGVDPDFSNCIDGMIWVNIARITAKKRDRYINNKENSVKYAPSFLSLTEKNKQNISK